MRVIVTIVLLMIVSLLRSQDEVTSFYFGESQPLQLEKADQIDASICGRYLFQEDTLKSLIIEKDSMYLRYSIITFLTEKEIKKSEKFRVENELIYGIKKGEGLPYIQRHDTLYTVIIQTETMFDPQKNILKKSDGYFFLNYKEKNGLYTVQILQKTNTGITIYSLDHDLVLEEILKFGNTKTKDVDGFKTYISIPTKSELISFVKNRGFRDELKYILPDKL